MSDDDKKATDAASVADTLKHIGGSESESSPHTRSANALADGIASQVALARRFNIRVMLRIEKTEALTKTRLLRMLRTMRRDAITGSSVDAELVQHFLVRAVKVQWNARVRLSVLNHRLQFVRSEIIRETNA